MSVLVVGSIALDSVTTPYGHRDDILGGAACYFAVAASFFGPVQLVGVIGDDFPPEHVRLLEARGVDLAGLDRRAGAKTFHWWGSYEGRMASATTKRTDLNVLGSFRPTLPEAFRRTPYVFLANGDPVTQSHVLDQLEAPEFVLLDTMNMWIDNSRAELMKLFKRVSAVVLNDDEARALAADQNLVRAIQKIAAMGPRTVVVKKGEHGALMLHEGELFALPAHPLEDVRDPTGAGDTFAAGFLGQLAASGDLSLSGLKLALACGTVVASFTVEKFSLDRLLEIDRADVDRRLAAFLAFTRF